MRENSIASWVISMTSLAVFVLTFFMLFKDSGEILSSLTAAILSTLLTLGCLIILSWLTQIFKK